MWDIKVLCPNVHHKIEYDNFYVYLGSAIYVYHKTVKQPQM